MIASLLSVSCYADKRRFTYVCEPKTWPVAAWELENWGEFYLQNHFTSKTFAASPKEANSTVFVKQIPFGKSGERPSWQFTKLPDGTFKIIELKTGKALTAGKSPTNSEVNVVLEAWADSSN